MPNQFIPLDIESLHSAYANKTLTPAELVSYILQRCEQYQDRNIWIEQLSLSQIEPYLKSIETKSAAELPLYGIPFAIKDNIDLAGIDTTAACEEFRYTPDQDAYIVACLIQAGAIPIGKTNMDQFATGLVGTRSPEPWGACKNAIDPSLISGGSSSGSAVAVALGLVSFALGTDTAGSGRVPAMLNNIVGHKPSRCLFSMSGVVPACRTLDCPSVLALTVGDAQRVFDVAADYDAEDSYARKNPYANSKRYWGTPNSAPKIAVPLKENLNFFDNVGGEKLFWESIDKWHELGAEIVEIDISPLLEAAKLLYSGPWVAERYAATEKLMENTPNVVHPVVRDIIASAKGKTAVETFQYEYQKQAYRRLAQQIFESIDFLISPTAPRTYTIDEMLSNPIELNSIMGHYTNYLNLLDLAGTSVPAGFSSEGLPFGITLIAPAMQDQALLSYAHQWQSALNLNVGALDYCPTLREAPSVNFDNSILVAVCGAHLSGMPLNWQLLERGASLVETTTTSENYKFYALAGGPPFRPGLVRADDGASIDIEVWQMPAENFGSFVTNIPAPLGIGKVETSAGEWVSSFICEPYGLDGAKEITHLKSWRAYIESL